MSAEGSTGRKERSLWSTTTPCAAIFSSKERMVSWAWITRGRATKVPRPGALSITPSKRRRARAWRTVTRLTPCSRESADSEGMGAPGGSSPAPIRRRMSASSRAYFGTNRSKSGTGSARGKRSMTKSSGC